MLLRNSILCRSSWFFGTLLMNWSSRCLRQQTYDTDTLNNNNNRVDCKYNGTTFRTRYPWNDTRNFHYFFSSINSKSENFLQSSNTKMTSSPASCHRIVQVCLHDLHNWNLISLLLRAWIIASWFSRLFKPCNKDREKYCAKSAKKNKNPTVFQFHIKYISHQQLSGW